MRKSQNIELHAVAEALSHFAYETCNYKPSGSRVLLMILVSLLSVPTPTSAQESPVRVADPDARRWTREQAWKWYQDQPWPCGFNYIPAHAISYTEMWMPYNFNATKIDGELALAQANGFNCARVVLPFVVWEADPAAFKARFTQFLEVCDRRGIKVMPALFDDCAFGQITDPIYGRQPVVIPGWYANGWTPSPGHAIVRDRAQWPRLEKYVRDIMSSFKDDARVWLWDVYNEPTNGGLGEVSVPLVAQVFDWARAVNPSQPLTCDVFGSSALQRLALEQSDIVTFHNYESAENLQANIDSLQLAGRPIICSEWLNRSAESTVESCLPVLARENVGAMHWGLVNGRTQTNLRWGAKPGQTTPQLWQHDLYRSEWTVESLPEGGYGFGAAYAPDATHPDATQIRPYNSTELALFESTIFTMARGPRAGAPSEKWLLPTAAASDPTNWWRYSTNAPSAGWETAAFNDAGWQTGLAGFGTEAPNAWPRTLWSTSDIWLRRSFELDEVPAQAQLWVHHDEAIEVFINGQKVLASADWTTVYRSVDLLAPERAALKPGRNLIAVHCHQTSGGQYVDVGLATSSR